MVLVQHFKIFSCLRTDANGCLINHCCEPSCVLQPSESSSGTASVPCQFSAMSPGILLFFFTWLQNRFPVACVCRNFGHVDIHDLHDIHDIHDIHVKIDKIVKITMICDVTDMQSMHKMYLNLQELNQLYDVYDVYEV